MTLCHQTCFLGLRLFAWVLWSPQGCGRTADLKSRSAAVRLGFVVAAGLWKSRRAGGRALRYPLTAESLDGEHAA